MGHGFGAQFRRVENREHLGKPADVDAWLDRFRRLWGPRLEALATEIGRGKRARRRRR